MKKASVVKTLAALVCGAAALYARGAGEMRWGVARFPSGEEFTLEIAIDDASRARGYMYRERVAPNEGMLFVFDETGSHGFWMKNCKVTLDIIWLDADFQVVDIAYEARPCPPDGDCPSVVPMRAARYVLEVAGGTARRAGLERGSRVTVWADPPLER